MLLLVAGILGRVSASHLSEVVKTCGTPHPKLLSPFDSIRGHHCFLIANDPRKRKVFRIFQNHQLSWEFFGWQPKKNIWVFPRIGIPQNGWFTMENPIKMDDLGGPPLFLETPIWKYDRQIDQGKKVLRIFEHLAPRCHMWQIALPTGPSKLQVPKMEVRQLAD